jgi:hypothetical protein
MKRRVKGDKEERRSKYLTTCGISQSQRNTRSHTDAFPKEKKENRASIVETLETTRQ